MAEINREIGLDGVLAGTDNKGCLEKSDSDEKITTKMVEDAGMRK